VSLRVIPRLDIKGPNLVKGIRLEGLRVLGKPERFARHYYESGADELLYMDAVASLYGRNSLTEIVRRTADEVFIPLTVGGGLRSVDDIRLVLRAGADKVSLNTAAIRRPELVREAAEAFGSSTVLVSIECKRRADGVYEAWTDYGRERTGIDVFDWARRAVDLGAGELMVTSIDRDGTGLGFDLDLIRRIALSVPVPVIAAGGAGGADHVVQAVREGAADAVAVASILHYGYARVCRYDPGEFAEEGNIEALLKGPSHSRIRETTIEGIKAALGPLGLEGRPAREAAR
jgi:cyclase